VSTYAPKQGQNRFPGLIIQRKRSPIRSRRQSAHCPSSTKGGSRIHRVRPASGFLLVAQSKATRRGGFSYNSGFIPPRRSRLGTNDKAGSISSNSFHLLIREARMVGIIPRMSLPAKRKDHVLLWADPLATLSQNIQSSLRRVITLDVFSGSLFGTTIVS
jgi:hypothetical protein